MPEDGVSTDNPSQAELEENQDFPKKKSAQKKNPKKTKTVALKTDKQDSSHDPAKAVENMDVHSELKAQLFAAEPLMLSPSSIDIDHLGRIWVCEVVNYRDFANRNNPVREKGDQIIILEDTDGDGKADNKKVFYQGRDIDSPHGICVIGEKVIVSANGKVFVFIDKDGDDKPDEKQVMYQGISGANHDHGIHAFVFAPDGKLYFNFGNAGKQLILPNGKPVVDIAGNVVNDKRTPYQEGMVFRQNLDGSEFETIGWNFRNNWMVCVDSFGGVWQSDNDDDGNRGVRINYVMEFGNYGYKDEFTGAGWRTDRTNSLELPMKHWHQNDPGVVPNMLHTGAGSPTGICVYEGNLLPTQFQGHLIHCDAGPSVTRAYIANDDGAGYSAEIVNILEGTRDKWFRPSDVKVAPDGSLIVADWYDPGVGGHRMGDVERGRLFRVIPKNHGGKYATPKFDFSTVEGSIKGLRNPNNSVRYLAWTSLNKMGAKAEPALKKIWEEDKDSRMRARALWLLGKIPGKGLHYVDLASRDEDKNIRCQSLRLARQVADVEVLPVIARLVNDSSPAVRRECCVALRHNKSDQAAKLWAELAKQHTGKDRWYLEALGIAADQQWDRFMAAWLEAVGGAWKSPGGLDLIWRSRGSKSAEWLGEVLADASTPKEQLPRFFRALDFLPEDKRDGVATELAFGKAAADPARRKTVMLEASRRIDADKVRNTPRFKQAINKSLGDFANTSSFVSLVSRFDLSERYPDLLKMAQSAPDGQLGVQAMRTLVQKKQHQFINESLNGDLVAANATLKALGNTGDGAAANLLRDFVKSDADIALRREAVRSMARINSGAKQLLNSITSKELDPPLLASASAVLHSSRWEDVRKRAQELMPLPPTKASEPLPSIGDLARMSGDVSNGQKIFSGVGTCSKCHIVNGQGKEVGPNLSEIGSKLSREAMFEAILYPSAGISHNYEAYNLVTVDGNAVTGLLTSKTDDEVVITSDDGIARKFASSDIEELQKQTTSLMPADLQKLMTKQELIDVVDYISTLKKK